MKESEYIKLKMEADNSDNDYRDLNYLKKIQRAERNESFIEGILPLLEKKYPIIQMEDKFKIQTDKFGILYYYPKANSLLITKDNYWAKGFGLRWIKKHLL